MYAVKAQSFTMNFRWNYGDDVFQEGTVFFTMSFIWNYVDDVCYEGTDFYDVR